MVKVISFFGSIAAIIGVIVAVNESHDPNVLSISKFFKTIYSSIFPSDSSVKSGTTYTLASNSNQKNISDNNIGTGDCPCVVKENLDSSTSSSNISGDSTDSIRKNNSSQNSELASSFVDSTQLNPKPAEGPSSPAKPTINREEIWRLRTIAIELSNEKKFNFFTNDERDIHDYINYLLRRKELLHECLLTVVIGSDTMFFQKVQSFYNETDNQIELLKDFQFNLSQTLRKDDDLKKFISSYFEHFKIFVFDFKNFQSEKTRELI